MAKTKAQKGQIIDTLADSFKAATSTVFVHFKGVNVADETAMRRALGNESVKYTVAKKTLIRLALQKLGHTTEGMTLEGEVAAAYGGGEDATVAARLVHDFGKKYTNRVSILGGIFDGKIVDRAQMEAIALIPSLQVLRGMFAQVINSPRQRLAVVLSAVAGTKQ